MQSYSLTENKSKLSLFDMVMSKKTSSFELN